MEVFIYVGIMAKSRYVKDSIRSDNWFTDLVVSEKLLFTYLLTNDKVGLCWVYELPLKKIQRETWIDSWTLWKAFERFESVWKVCYRNGRVMIVNFLKNQSMNDNMIKWAKREAENITKDVWLSFADFKGFQRISKDFECFDILNLTLLNFTLPNGDVPQKKVTKKIQPKKKTTFSTPTIEEVEQYFTSNQYNIAIARKAWNFYEVADWHDSQGNKVRNRKQKMQSVWFKEENKIKGWMKTLTPEEIAERTQWRIYS